MSLCSHVLATTAKRQKVFGCREEITTVVTGDSEIILEQGLRPNGNMARNAGPLVDEICELLEGKGSGI
jgi:hypothetical protein